MGGPSILVLAVASLAGAGSLAAARGWPLGLWLRRTWRRVEPYVGAYMRRSPATFIYAGVIFVTTWVLDGLSPSVSLALLRSQSTNLDNLRTHPVAVLFRSAFWSGVPEALPIVALLAAVLAPAEVWLGTGRLIFVFWLGHVGATLITAVAIDQGYFSSPAQQLDRTVDVGVSYGVFCVAAVLTHRLPRGWRLPSAGGLLLLFGLLAFVISGTFTDFGHFVSVLIGLAIYPVVHSRTTDERARIPLYRPWLAQPPRLRAGDSPQ